MHVSVHVQCSCAVALVPLSWQSYYLDLPDVRTKPLVVGGSRPSKYICVGLTRTRGAGFWLDACI